MTVEIFLFEIFSVIDGLKEKQQPITSNVRGTKIIWKREIRFLDVLEKPHQLENWSPVNIFISLYQI